VAEIIDLGAAVALVRDGDHVLVGGSGGGHAVPEAWIAALAARFRETGRPRGLSLMSVVSLGDWKTTGFNRLAQPGLIRRVVSAGFNNCPAVGAMAAADEIEAYTLPQGALSQLCRDMAAGRPGLLTRTGLHTFVDPRLGGGKQSARTTEDLVEPVTLHGEEYLFYRAQPIDPAVIRGTTADERGNVTMEDEPYFGEQLSIAQAARNRGATVICQVGRLAGAGTLPGKQVKVPGRWWTIWSSCPTSGRPTSPGTTRRTRARSAVRRRRSRGCRSTSGRSLPGGPPSSSSPGRS
jgi:propionate CoA-transferase